MPDSFTKFKEEEPKTSVSSSGGSTDNDDDDTESGDESDIVYTIDSVFILQEAGDVVFFETDSDDSFVIGDNINVSADVLGIGAIDDVGTIQGIYSVEDGEEVVTVLVVSLDGSAVIGPSTYISSGSYFDNCVAGYGQCAAGSTGAGAITSDAIFYIPMTAVPSGSTYNFNKAITVTGTSSSGYSTANLGFEYTLSQTVTGLGMATNTSGVQTDDRLVSPYGPFLPNSNLNFTGEEDSVLTITVSVAEGFYGNELNEEETATVNFLGSTVIPGEEVASSEVVALSYPMLDTQRIALKVENISGYSVGDTILSCRLNSIANCTEASGYVVGRAQVTGINTDLKVIYATAEGYNGGADNSTFPRSNYVMNSTVSSVQSERAQIVFSTSDTGITLAPQWKNNGAVVAAPANTIYSISMGTNIGGISLSSTTGNISINGLQNTVGNSVTITAIDSVTNEDIASFNIDINSIGSPTSIKVVDGTNEYLANPGDPFEFQVAISDSDSVNINSTVPAAFPSEDAFGLGYIYYTFDASLPTGATFTNSLSANRVGTLDFSPGTYIAGTVYTVEGFHPALSGATSFDDLEIELKSGTDFASIFYPQVSGEKLILKVNSTAAFNVGDTISNNDNSRATVNFINEDQGRLFVTMAATPTKANRQFKADDTLDKTSTYVTSRATVEEVIHVFDVTNTTLSKSPAFFNDLGNEDTLKAGETLTWAVTPSLPADLQLDVNGNLSVVGAPASLSVLSETVYTIQGTNNISDSTQVSYKMAIAKSPANASVARYQILKLSANGKKFYRGTRISTPDDGDSSTIEPSGRVLMTLDTDAINGTDTLLVEGNGVFLDGVGIDNTPSFYASEATVVPHVFMYIKDPTQLAVTDNITGSSGATGVVVDKNNASGVAYVRVTSGSFSTGETVTGSGSPTTIDNVETNHFITHVFEMSAVGNFDVGELITGATADDVAVVVAVDSPYIFVRQVKPSSSAGTGSFSQGDTITDANSVSRTLDGVVGPNITISVTGGTAGAHNSSGTEAENNEFFYEGQPITCYNAADTYMASGFAVAGTDFLGSNKVVMQVEDFDSHCYFAGNNYIDDISAGPQTNQTGTDANEITGISSANLMVGYVGDSFFLDTFVQGEITSASIQPEVLPSGLIFNTTSGEISGVPTSPATVENYTITFYSSDGQSISYDFDLVIYNQFEVSQLTDSASSFLMHKEGQGYGATYCRVITPQVIDDNADSRYNQYIYGFNDVLCRLEGGEGDLYNSGVSFNITAGAGMCEYVTYTPFSYKPFLPGKTERYIVKYEDFGDAGSCGSGDIVETTDGNATNAVWGPNSNLRLVVPATLNSGGGAPATAAQLGAAGATDPSFGSDAYCLDGDCIKLESADDLCRFDYSRGNSNWPNLDEGTVTVATVNCSYEEDEDADTGDVTTHCNCTASETVINCGGDSNNNMGGPKSVWSADNTDEAIVYDSNSGLEKIEEITNPRDLQTKNSFVANYLSIDSWTTAGQCYENNFHVNAYSAVGVLEDNVAAWNSYVQPLDPLGSAGVTGVVDYDNFYTFNCLDAAYNVKARIRVQVRDWDREFTPELAALERVTSNSMMDDSSFDSIYDLDGFFTGKPAANIPQYNTCGAAAETTYTVTQTLTVEMGSSTATFSAAVSNAQAFPAGSVLLLTFSDGSSDYYLAGSGLLNGNTEVELATIPAFGDTGVTVEVVRKVPFPLK